MWTDGGLWSLFSGAVLTSTLLPGGVEGLLVWLIAREEYSFWPLFIAAATGSVTGALVTFWMGRLLYTGLHRSKFSGRLAAGFKLQDKAVERVRKWGAPVLLLSFLPVIGDPVCLAAGFIGTRLWPSLLMIVISKSGRYLVLIYGLQQAMA